MQSAVSDYLSHIQESLHSGHATEHTYRGALETLFRVATGLAVHNEPKGSAHGRPDFIFTKGETPIAWAEAKDLHIDLAKVEKSEQMGRYFGYPNLILTNGLAFRFYKNGDAYGEPITIGIKKGDHIEAVPAAYDTLLRTLAEFVQEPMQTINSAKHLAKIMGGKARRLRDNIRDMLSPEFTGNRGDIDAVMDALRSKLIHDLSPEQFADLYAQTLVYGLFAARYNDDTPDTFSRSEARERIPAGNQLLHQFFDHIAGANFVKRLSHIVDELCDVFVHADVHALVHGLYEKKEQTHDPIIHFYEDFLREYDPKLRTERGVFYTPLPVVRFIVRSVDRILQQHFSLPQGLADRAQIDWTFKDQNTKSIKKIDRVQILDPATGTGTFLHEVIREIHQKFQGQEGMWEQYVHDHLLPRLHGFELMMASYTIAHLKLSMTLAETGVTKLRKRIRIFLTNSLEEAPERDDTLFRGLGLDGALTEEALLAEEVKRDMPIMVVLGNPPYSVSSSNKGSWITDLIHTYKDGLNERSYNALSDDYVKFIRFAHHLVEKNGQGIVAMITNNSFLDGLVHRKMRESLLRTFDKIYILDLHGSSKKKEVAPDGGKDENVFDIQQGVSISIFVQSGEKKKKDVHATVHYCELYGKRERKYEWLDTHDVQTANWTTLDVPQPNFFFVPKDFEMESEYKKGRAVDQLFSLWNSGIKTHRDHLAIAFSEREIKERIMDIIDSSKATNVLREKYVIKDTRDWKFEDARTLLQSMNDPSERIQNITYRPFDSRRCFYGNEMMDWPREEIMQHMLKGGNYAYCLMRSTVNSPSFNTVFATQQPIDLNFYGFQTYLFPLYLYPDSATVEGVHRTPNLKMELLQPILNALQLTWIEDGTGNGKDTCGPEDIFDYIYAVLHSPAYRDRYKEFLKIDFPRVPFTKKKESFWALVALGRQLRQLHLLESPVLEKLITTYPIAGDNTVEKLRYEDGKVWINATQYFGNVPEEAWNFPIGGYTPAQKWLKDRKGRTLDSDDILHYQRMIVALVETAKLMQEVDAVCVFPME